jgi:hypothetical protein
MPFDVAHRLSCDRRLEGGKIPHDIDGDGGHDQLETISIKAARLTITLPCGTNREGDHEGMYTANHLGSA